MSKADYKNPIPSKSQHALSVQQLGLKIVSGEISENENKKFFSYYFNFVNIYKSPESHFCEFKKINNYFGYMTKIIPNK